MREKEKGKGLVYLDVFDPFTLAVSPLGTTVFSLQDGTGTGVLYAEQRLIATGGEPFVCQLGLF